MNQAAQAARRSPAFAASYAAIASRRGKKIATIAVALPEVPSPGRDAQAHADERANTLLI
jgi:hypothetical protein